MPKTLFVLLAVILLLTAVPQDQSPADRTAILKAWQSAASLYRTATVQAERAGSDSLQQALADKYYRQSLEAMIPVLQEADAAGWDSLSCLVRLQTGYTCYYFDSTQAAKTDFLSAFALQEKKPLLADSLFFTPFIYTGGLYYNEQQFDSALYWYKKAESVNDRYSRPLPGSQRLYNRLGAMQYETGNYKQARNYFEKAIALTPATEKSLLTNYRINIASLLSKLEEAEAARKMYESLLPSPEFENEIYHNLAIISLKQNDYLTCIDYLRRVNYSNDKRSIDLYYNYGVAYAGLGKTDSADFYIQRALAENIKWNGRRKNIAYGLILKFQADELAKQQLYREATLIYQQAIIQFHNNFRTTEPDRNPVEFSGVFSYINLFNALASKALAFENLYRQEKDIELLKISLQTYQSAFKLASYVENTYDSDEARLFIGKIKHRAHSRPIDVCLQLYDLTQKRNYLEEAYNFDQQNKASVLTNTIRENEWKTENLPASPLVHKEQDLKSRITRLTLKAAGIADSVSLSAINSQIRDEEIALGKIQEKLNNDPGWKEHKNYNRIPPVSQLQKTLDNTTALLSFHLSENELLTLLITPSRFEYHKTAINKNFLLAVENFKSALHNTTADQRYQGVSAATILYDKIIAPVAGKLLQTKRLIIIPDDELHYLPFEALQDDNKKYLVERFAVQYQYTTALLRISKGGGSTRVLAFAPFADRGYRDSSNQSFSVLPNSRDEIAGLKGTAYTNSSATLGRFLEASNHAGIIHFATHAVVDNENPGRSFIAFYPDSNNYKLYAAEIANLRLDSTSLVILSACETGTGQLVKGEGLMSLSRAFAYAGCANVITSLWKAEDKATAFLMKQLHHYIDKGQTRDKALQLAKLDLLANKSIDPRLKSPNYWAHLVFIGDYEAKHNSSNWWWMALTIIVSAIAYKILSKKK